MPIREPTDEDCADLLTAALEGRSVWRWCDWEEASRLLRALRDPRRPGWYGPGLLKRTGRILEIPIWERETGKSLGTITWETIRTGIQRVLQSGFDVPDEVRENVRADFLDEGALEERIQEREIDHIVQAGLFNAVLYP